LTSPYVEATIRAFLSRVPALTDRLSLKKTAIREAVLLCWLLLAGVVALPIAVWFIGQALFGEYGGSGFGDFFAELNLRILTGDKVAWFLVLSPYIGVTTLRLMAWAWRASKPPQA